MGGVEENREGDEGLVGRFLGTRSEAAFRALYREHSSYLFGLALRLCGGRRDQAEEALQEAWIRAAAKLDGFRWHSSLRTWLGGIVVNCCREEFRRRHRAPGPTLVQSAAAESEAELSPGERPDVRLNRQIDLERFLAELPAGQRQVVVLYAIEGHTHEEIGRLLEIAPGTSKSRLFEARRRLRRRREAYRDSGDRP